MIGCDYDPTDPAVWHVKAVGDDVPDLLASRFACAGHLDSAKEVVGHGGREIQVTALVESAAGEDADQPATLAEKFEAFHAGNPHVYATLVRLAREWVRRTGRQKIGIAMLWERMRWELALQTTDEDPAFDNNHKAFYARLIMRDEPDLAELFDLRRSIADEWVKAA